MTAHVGILFEFPTLNGGEHSMLAVLRHLARSSEFHFTALAPPEGRLAEQLHRLSVPLLPFAVRDSTGKKRDPAELHSALRTVLSEENFSILHSNSLSMCRFAGRMEEFPLGTKRTGHLRDIVRLSKAAVSDINRNDALIAVSSATRSFHIQQGLTPQRCHVVHNGINTSQFSPDDKDSLRQKLFPDIPGDARLLLNVGQICLRKGQLDLAKAVCQMLRSRTDIHLVIVGERHSAKQESIEYERAVQNEFEAVNRAGHLHMPGFRSDIPDLMNAADLLVHTSRQEPFGRTLLEAAACGLPIVATDVGGTPEMLRDGTDAILTEPGHPESLSETVAGALGKPDNLRRMARSAREHVTREFSIAAAADRTAAFWKNQLEEDSAAA